MGGGAGLARPCRVIHIVIFDHFGSPFFFCTPINRVTRSRRYYDTTAQQQCLQYRYDSACIDTAGGVQFDTCLLLAILLYFLYVAGVLCTIMCFFLRGVHDVVVFFQGRLPIRPIGCVLGVTGKVCVSVSFFFFFSFYEYSILSCCRCSAVLRDMYNSSSYHFYISRTDCVHRSHCWSCFVHHTPAVLYYLLQTNTIVQQTR